MIDNKKAKMRSLAAICIAILAALAPGRAAHASALNIITTAEGVAICTDTGTYNDRGEVGGFRQKIILAPHARAIVGFSGSMGFFDLLSMGVAGAGSGAEIVADIRLVVKSLGEIAMADQPFQMRSATLYVADYPAGSPHPNAWKITIAENYLRPITVETVPVGRIQLSPELVLDAASIAAFRQPSGVVCGQILERQRKRAYVIGGWNEGKPTHIVGGAAIYAVVKPDGSVFGKIVRKWPDVVGARIKPEGDE